VSVAAKKMSKADAAIEELRAYGQTDG